EYEYEINATTGAIIKSEVDKEKVSSGSSSSTLITVDEAKSIAAAHAGYSVSEVTFKKAKLDTDDGLTVYEIEFYVGNVEYEYEINASTGAVIEYEMDHD
ncbi:MAG: PepSY domain-containing protein, partial [Lachnospiraceae bacterium]|nr:PepSY domain-containing protein [Lachnospiraceae bacterium]